MVIGYIHKQIDKLEICIVGPFTNPKELQCVHKLVQTREIKFEIF